MYGSYTIQLYISLWPKLILVDNLWPNLLTPVIANGRGGLLLLPVYASSLGLSISQRHFLRISLRFMMVSSLGPFIHIIKLWPGHEWLITKHSILCDIITHPSPYFKGTRLCCDLLWLGNSRFNSYPSWVISLKLGAMLWFAPVVVQQHRWIRVNKSHYNDVIMTAMASQITSLDIVYSTVYWGTDQRKHQRSTSLAFVRGILRWPVSSPHKWPVTRFPFDGVIMW